MSFLQRWTNITLFYAWQILDDVWRAQKYGFLGLSLALFLQFIYQRDREQSTKQTYLHKTFLDFSSIHNGLSTFSNQSSTIDPIFLNPKKSGYCTEYQLQFQAIAWRISFITIYAFFFLVLLLGFPTLLLACCGWFRVVLFVL